MDEPDLSSLTYKELQALAVRCRVPGNIKKHQLVRVLDAVQRGNMLEVDRIIAELQQTRKKRLRKTKPDKMNVVSTPLHSPDVDDYYYSQQHPPYQWVGAEEEISSREEDASRFPEYYEFKQFLSRRIKYRSYVASDSELAQMPSVVDLRMSAGTSIAHPTDVNRDKSNIVLNPYSFVQPVLDTGEIEAEENTNGNNQVPIILKKMLQAPAGANLEQIASPKAVVSQIPSLEQRPNNSNEQMDDSDTLTADSDGDNDDFWDFNHTGNNNRDYYPIINNSENPLNNNQGQFQDKNVQETSQVSGNFLFNGNNQYQNIGNASDVQVNCQKWIATNSFVNRDANYGGYSVDISRSYNPSYCVNASNNARVTIARNLEQDCQSNENMNCETGQWNLQGQSGNEAYPYYQINNNEAAHTSVIPNDYVQHLAKRMCDATEKYFAQGSNNNWHTTISCNNSQAVAQPSPAAQLDGSSYGKEMEGSLQNSENNVMQYNMGYYQQYPIENNQPQIGYPNGDQYQYQQQQQQQQFHLPQHQQATQHHQYQNQTQQQYQEQANVPVQEIIDCKNLKQSMASQAIASGALDAFWPHKPINTMTTSAGQLETILNLNNNQIPDSAKLDQTSCVDCYIAPIATRRTEFSNLLCTQGKQFKARFRQHSFRSTPLVYNDASTGMRLANTIGISFMEACPQGSLNDVPSGSSMDLDSENMASMESSDDSINDVWIHDYTRCPSTDYAPQSDCLVIDENENDLFSL